MVIENKRARINNVAEILKVNNADEFVELSATSGSSPMEKGNVDNMAMLTFTSRCYRRCGERGAAGKLNRKLCVLGRGNLSRLLSKCVCGWGGGGIFLRTVFRENHSETVRNRVYFEFSLDWLIMQTTFFCMWSLPSTGFPRKITRVYPPCDSRPS